MPRNFFDVPVYRLPEDRYYANRKRYVDGLMYGGTPAFAQSQRELYAEHPDLRIADEGRFSIYYGGAWDFNEIVGFIRLHFLGTQLRGELWMVNRKRIVRTRRKLFKYRTHKVVYETDIPPHASNQEIYEQVLKYLQRAAKELRPRHIDTTMLETIGPFVDWNALRKAFN
jgi:hypothetical protein